MGKINLRWLLAGVVLIIFGLFTGTKAVSADVVVQGMHLSEEEYQQLVETIPKGHRLVTNEEFEELFSSSELARSARGLFHQAHVQSFDWQPTRSASTPAGTTGHGLRIEALRLQMLNMNTSVSYRFHIQSRGWESWKTNGQVAGTVGQGLRTEAIQIRTSGLYGVNYRAHVQGQGWLPWVSSGQTAMFGNFAGTTGQARRLEAIAFALYVQQV